MKQSFITLLFICVSTFIFGQQDEALYTRIWPEGQTVKIFGHDVLRVFGEQYNRYSDNNTFIPITNVAYQTQDQIIEEIKEEGKKSSWSEKKLDKELNKIKQNAAGGMVVLYLRRNSQDAANTKWYTITVRDKDEKVLFKKTLSWQVPNMEDFDQWSNTAYIDIDIPLTIPFYIYVSQLQMSNINDYKFEILN
jgi:uncharacterized protein YheU (UPF0270 family)